RSGICTRNSITCCAGSTTGYLRFSRSRSNYCKNSAVTNASRAFHGRKVSQHTGVVSGFVFDGRGAIAGTTDGGMNWSTLFFDQPIEAIDFPRTTSGFSIGWGGRILHSTVTGITWTDQTSGTSANLNDVSFANTLRATHFLQLCKSKRQTVCISLGRVISCCNLVQLHRCEGNC